jgi:poly(A) polymerase
MAEEPFLKLALQDTDRRVGEGKPVAPSFMLSCVLWADVRHGWDWRLKRGDAPMPALQDAIDEAFNARIGDVSGRGKLGIDMREIWSMQPRFEKRTGNAPYSLLEQPRFRAGFDFLRLRGVIGEIDPALAQWWETFSTAYDDERHDMVEALRQSQQKKPQPRVRVKRPAAPADAGTPGADGVPVADGAAPATASASANPVGLEGIEPAWQEGDVAPAKKRRRRKKPASRSAEGADGAQGGQGAEGTQGESSAQSSTRRSQSANEAPPAPGAFAPVSDY